MNNEAQPNQSITMNNLFQLSFLGQMEIQAGDSSTFIQNLIRFSRLPFFHSLSSDISTKLKETFVLFLMLKLFL